MKIGVMILPVLGLLGLLAGCSKSNGSAEESSGKSPTATAEIKELRQQVESLSETARALERRVDELDLRNAYLEKMLATAEQDLRSRLSEMVQQEMGAGGRGMGQRFIRPAALPRPYLGFDGETNSPETAKKLGLPVTTGLLVGEVTPGAPADLGGLRKGDLLHSVNDKSVETRDALIQVVSELKPGQEVRLGVSRGEEQLKLKVAVGAR